MHIIPKLKSSTFLSTWQLPVTTKGNYEQLIMLVNNVEDDNIAPHLIDHDLTEGLFFVTSMTSMTSRLMFMLVLLQQLISHGSVARTCLPPPEQWARSTSET
jgi:hypothetical protein